MANSAANPLFKHFRQPSVYIKLPGRGKFWATGSLDLPPTGEIAIYPMTVKDEVLIKTPDALMNGSGVVDVIQSCCPNIKDAWQVPVIDLDAILIAIRIASYGAIMDIDTKCPHCGAENTHGVDLRVVLDEVRPPEYDPLTINDLVFYLKPQTFKNLNANNIISYEQQKLIATLASSDLTEDQKIEQFQLMFPKLTDLNIMAVVNCIDGIQADGDLVKDTGYIKEFVSNCDRATYQGIKDKIDEYIDASKMQPIHAQCNECTKEYTTEITFEQANFFG